jgi:hypothetical protein
MSQFTRRSSQGAETTLMVRTKAEVKRLVGDEHPLVS